MLEKLKRTFFGSRKTITAGELIAQLERDEDFQKEKAVRDAKLAEFNSLVREDERTLIWEIRLSGVDLDSVWDLVNREFDYGSAVPVLKSHLSIDHQPRVLQGIVRSLTVDILRNDDALWDLLLGLYKRTLNDAEISDPGRRGLRSAIAFALEVLATEERADSLGRLIEECKSADAVFVLEDRLQHLRTSQA